MQPKRRQVLKAASVIGGTGLGVSLAGCAGQSGDGSGGGGGGGDGQAEMTEEPTATPTMEPETETEMPSTEEPGVTVSIRDHPQLGSVLTDGSGNTLYMFVPDEEGQSVCTGNCAEVWPPLTVESEEAVEAGSGVTADLGVTERDDGSLQITANGMPLYYFARDEAPGDAVGQEVGNVWFVLRPDATVVKPTVSVREHDELGQLITDADGNTLYMFVPDEEGQSNCTGGCAEAWPPLTVESRDALVDSVVADVNLGVTEREDGSLHVTANGMPLYYFVRDETPGDATGQELNNVWFVLRPDGSILKPTVSVREHEEYGQLLTDADGMTLYMFTNDQNGESVCTGGCAEAWPPLTVENRDALVDSVIADVELSVFERSDGSLQVRAGDLPLYYFASDEEPGDITGQGVNGVWYVLRPDGAVIRDTMSSGNGSNGY